MFPYSLPPGESKVITYMVTPDRLGKQKFVLNIKLKGNKNLLYLITATGKPNKFGLAPINEYVLQGHLAKIPIIATNLGKIPAFINGYD